VILAADHAEGNGPPPPELVKAWECQRWKALPNAGGLHDQPLGLMHRMNAALTVYAAMNLYNAAERAGLIDEKWMSEHRREMSIWAQVQLLRAQQSEEKKGAE